MRTIHLAALLSAAAATTAGLAGCLKKAAFSCGADDNACVGGVCEPEGYCSIAVATSECPSGRRFSDTAGDGLAGQCVGGGPTTDGPGPDPDGPDPDGPPPDSPPTGCGVGYDTIAGGTAGHKYMLVATPGTWINQQNAVCNTSGGYMAIPDDAAELTAIFVAGGNTQIWLGVSDRLNEGSFIDTKNQPYTALTLAGNGNNDDCATTDDGVAPLVIADCDGAQQLSLPTVCECEE